MTNTTESQSIAIARSTPRDRTISPWMMIGVLIALLMLTAATVALTRVDMGDTVNLWLALGVAGTQGLLVSLYFMRLRWDSPFNGVVLVAALFFVALFIGIAVLDSREYHPNLAPPTGIAPQP